MTPLTEIRQEGFEVTISGDAFDVYPASRLTQEQREFIKLHKVEILSELAAANLKAEQTALEIITKFVTCYSPSGLCYEVEARDDDHAAFLQKMNPKRLNYGE